MTARHEILRVLAERIRQVETSHRSGASLDASESSSLADLFPARRLPTGALIELVSARDGAGAWTLAMLLARLYCEPPKYLLIADHQGSYYAPAAIRYGIRPERSMVLQSRQPRAALLGCRQALGCPAIGAVVGFFEFLSERDQRRMQLAAESSAGVALMLRPSSARRAPSFAPYRMLLSPLPSGGGGRRIQIEMLRCRGGHDGRVVVLEIDHETNDVRVLPRLAAAASAINEARGTDAPPCDFPPPRAAREHDLDVLPTGSARRDPPQHAAG